MQNPKLQVPRALQTGSELTMKDFQLVNKTLDDVHYVDDVSWSVQMVHGPPQGAQGDFWIFLEGHGYCNNLHQDCDI